LRQSQELQMFRISALSGVSTLVLGGAMFAPCPPAIAQTSGSALPAITVDAPKQRPVARPAKKPQRQATAAAGRKKPVARAAANPPGPQSDSSGVIASLGTPPVKQRFALPQESYSITAKQIEDTINLKDPEDAIKYFPSLPRTPMRAASPALLRAIVRASFPGCLASTTRTAISSR